MSAYPSWALLCGILGCVGAVILLAWHTAQEQQAGRFDSLVAVVARSQSLVLFRAVAIARWTCIGVLAIAVVGLIVVTCVVLVLAGIRARRLEINYGTD